MADQESMERKLDAVSIKNPSESHYVPEPIVPELNLPAQSSEKYSKHVTFGQKKK